MHAKACSVQDTDAQTINGMASIIEDMLADASVRPTAFEVRKRFLEVLQVSTKGHDPVKPGSSHGEHKWCSLPRKAPEQLPSKMCEVATDSVRTVSVTHA
jgi:hypothetical protein